MRKILNKIKDKSGFTGTIETAIIVVFLFGILLGGLEIFRHISRIQDLQQMSNFMAREVAIEGAVDERVYDALARLEQTYNMPVEMNVDGTFISGNQLQLESDFTVTLKYKTKLAIGIINRKADKEYIAKSVGKSEEYH
ncbi:MAG: DUF4320 family protein [Oscillospiraceae bacterium]